MLVEINLLPQKEPKKFAFIVTLSCLLAMIVLIGGFYFWQTQSIKDEMSSLDRQISMTQKIASKEEQSSETVESASSVNQLKSAIEWANDYPIQTIPVMRHLTSLLPERGFIQSFGYTESGTVTLSVQFDSAREAAYFLDSLNQSNWIDEASLSSLAATEQSETETNATTTTVASNSQDNTTNSTTTTANQTTTDPNTTVDDQNNTTAGSTVNQNNQTNTTTNQNSNNNTTVTSTSKTAKKISNYLPRYTGQFEIIFNKEEIKKIVKKSKSTEEGVSGS
ncbi:PilN domain-containing protein [Neobacillus soli]|uniref:PilN domain-containing protein n=1 Tax=Neobacillus soli TaxID=220688 RepID=UPI0008266775|nr:PilN domain-containing protein [Neobacillus soli]